MAVGPAVYREGNGKNDVRNWNLDSMKFLRYQIFYFMDWFMVIVSRLFQIVFNITNNKYGRIQFIHLKNTF